MFPLRRLGQNKTSPKKTMPSAIRTEEQIIYAVGKNPKMSERKTIATGRFIEALVDEPGDPSG